MPSYSEVFTCKEKKSQDDAEAATAGVSYLHPRLGRRAWLAPLGLDLLLTQAAEVAAELLARRLPGSAGGGVSAGVIEVVIESPGVLRREAGRLKLSTKDWQFYQTLQRWVRAGAFAGYAGLPEGGLSVEWENSTVK